MKRLLFNLLLFAGVAQLHAQQKTESIWQTFQLPVRINQKLSLHNDAGYRTLGINIQPRQYLFRTGVRYHFSSSTDVAAGIALFFSKTNLNKEEKEFGREFRLWQEAQKQVKLLKHTYVLIRFRTEQRFFESTSIREDYHAFRFRYRGTLQQELGKRLQLHAGFEYMHQLQDDMNEFNQYRIQPSILWKINEQLQLQTMCMMLKTPDEWQRALWMTWIYSFK